MDAFRRNLLKSAAFLLVDQWASSHRRVFADEPLENARRKVIVVTCGGIRRADIFSESGIQNIPHIYQEMLPQSIFYPFVQNAGVTSHYNTISSILTGNWQRLDDWGKTPPASPTLFEFVRKRIGLSQDQGWLISSNKALTSKIGASSVRDFGPNYGANVVFPKQLLINAVSRQNSIGLCFHSLPASMSRAVLRQNAFGLHFHSFPDCTSRWIRAALNR